jgi:spore maturation protein CgeB
MWPGLEDLFVPGDEILLADDTDCVLTYLTSLTEAERLAIGTRAAARVLREHTATQRAEELERHVRDAGRVAGSDDVAVAGRR